MCGIAAIVGFSEKGKAQLERIKSCGPLLRHRGPDTQQFIQHENFALAHARLSIIDLSEQSNQPFTTHNKRFTLVYNGEIFNYRELRSELQSKGHAFVTDGDVEVLAALYGEYGALCLQKINGFFAFVIYDSERKTFFCARDRFGVKPFYFQHNSDFFACASELRALISITGTSAVDKAALYTYLQLTYTPENTCMLQGIQKLEPGSSLLLQDGKITIEKYYSVKLPSSYSVPENPQKKLLGLLESSVAARMVSDVPVASFLSGGIDSSVITALAAGLNKNLQTFSVGFKGNKQFDESGYAEAVARKYKTDHHTFYFTESEAENEIENFFDSIDEPFADSSAFNMYVLAKKTKQHVRVVLSGDGADELFAGYNKHRAEWMIRHQRMKSLLLKNSGALAGLWPASRNSRLANKVRQLQRFANGARLSVPERYWRWASFCEEKKAASLLRLSPSEKAAFASLKKRYTGLLNEDFNSVLLADVNLVLPSDMLTKVDRMSMAHGLEVRTPFLDYRLVEFAFSLNARYKIDAQGQKKILKESCAHLLPAEILNRKKHGFETPVQQWLTGVLQKKVDELLLNKDFIAQQGIFEESTLRATVKKAMSNNPGESAAVTWALLVFNHWYKKHML